MTAFQLGWASNVELVGSPCHFPYAVRRMAEASRGKRETQGSTRAVSVTNKALSCEQQFPADRGPPTSDVRTQLRQETARHDVNPWAQDKALGREALPPGQPGSGGEQSGPRRRRAVDHFIGNLLAIRGQERF